MCYLLQIFHPSKLNLQMPTQVVLSNQMSYHVLPSSRYFPVSLIQIKFKTMNRTFRVHLETLCLVTASTLFPVHFISPFLSSSGFQASPCLEDFVAFPGLLFLCQSGLLSLILLVSNQTTTFSNSRMNLNVIIHLK